MKIYDISLPISPAMAVWPGDPYVEIQQLSSIDNGEEANVSQIRMSVHTGTHIDAPKHFLQGAGSIDKLPIEKLMGETLVLRIDDKVDVIDEKTLKDHPNIDDLVNCRKVLFKTRNSQYWDKYQTKFNEKFVGLNTSAAIFLAELNLDLIGLDYLSIAAYTDSEEPHKILLGKEIILLEGINLHGVLQGTYHLICLPLPIVNSDGAPARAILTEKGSFG
ncbi:MAG TPA: cyclase [Clostridiales bacterium]|nr:cyclase [Clostridiales bacterium]